MKSRKILIFVLVIIMSFSALMPVSAESLMSEESMHQTEPDYENDPLYLRYQNQPMTMAEIYGASELAHDTRFNKTDRVYGIDVSYFNEEIDWNKVKKSGIDFVIIRAGYRGYVNGALVEDVMFKENLAGAKKAGVAVGLYFFTQAISTKEAKEEAEFVLDMLDGETLELPIYFDIEEISYGSSRFDKANLSYNAKTNICKTFCNTIKSAGYRAGVYASKYWLTSLIDGEYLGKYYDIWIARYNTEVDYDGEYNMWQYTGQGRVSGVPTVVDMNVLYMSKMPPSVANLTADNYTGSEITLSWNDNSIVQGYKVYAENMATGKVKAVAQTTDTSVTLPIPYGQTGFFVRAYYKIGDSYSYSTNSFTIKVNSKQVTELTVTERKQTYLTLGWTKLEQASGYQIMMYNEELGGYAVVGYSNEPTYTIDGLNVGAECRFRVVPYYNEDGSADFNEMTSEYGVLSDELVTGTLTGKATNVAGKVTGTTRVTAMWDRIAENCNGYEILLHDYSKGKSYVVGTASAYANNYLITGLKPGSNYRVAVRAFYYVDGKKIQGYCSTSADVITYSNPVTNLTAIRNSSTSAKLTWTKSTGADGYYIYEIIDGKYVRIGSSLTNSYVAENLPEYTTRKFSVKAYRNFDEKDYLSAPCKAVSLNLAAAPTKFSISDYTETTLTIKWNKITDATKYKVELYTNTGKLLRTHYTKNTYIKFTKLTKNTTYKVIVKAVYGSLLSEKSVTQVVSTRRTPPTALKFTSVGSTYATLSWKKVSGATNYWIYKYNPSTKKYTKYKEVGNVSSAKLTGLTRNTSHRFFVCAVKKTTLKDFQSHHSAGITVWTKR